MSAGGFSNGKTTNALEKVVEFYFKKQDYQAEIELIKKNHIDIAKVYFQKIIRFLEISLFLMISILF
jgi:aspartate kinase